MKFKSGDKVTVDMDKWSKRDASQFFMLKERYPGFDTLIYTVLNDVKYEDELVYFNKNDTVKLDGFFAWKFKLYTNRKNTKPEWL